MICQAVLALIICPVAAWAYQLRSTLWAPQSFTQPPLPAVFLETLYHVSPSAYCSFLQRTSIEPLAFNPESQTQQEILSLLLAQTTLNTHQKSLLELSLSIDEFGPAASFHGTSTSHNCSSSDNYETIYTDLTSAFDFTESTIVRYKLPESDASKGRRKSMAGYGAQLALKRTDYLVIDDSNPTTPKANVETTKVEPLKMNQISNIGLRAVSRVMGSENPLLELQDISQNFPMRAQRLLGSKVSKALKDELKKIREIVAGDIFLVNGRKLDPNPAVLLPALRSESALAAAMRKIGVDTADVINLLTFDLELPPKIDRFDVRSPAVIYLNNFEADRMYRQWPTSVETFMRPLYPGQLHTIGRNAHTLFINLDFTDPEDRELLANFASFVTRGLPVRWGIIPRSETQTQRDLAKTYREVLRTNGVSIATEYLAATVGSSDIASAYAAIGKRGDRVEMSGFEQLVDTAREAQDWVARFGAGKAYSNGRPLLRDENMMQRLSAQLRDDTMMIQERFIEGGIADSGDLQDFWMGEAPLQRFSEVLFGERQYASLEEIEKRDSTCNEEFEITLFGSGWPVEDLAENNPCITRAEGPRRMIINGRILENLAVSELTLLLQQEKEEFDKYAAAAERINVKLTARTLALLRSSTALRTTLPAMESNSTHFTIGDRKGSLVHIEVYVDPLSENAQVWSSILVTLYKLPSVYIRVQLVPRFGMKELPLKRFYRYLLPATPTFKDDFIEFDHIPSDLVVFDLDIWNNWVAAPVRAAVDLDNLHLGSSSYDVDFEITHILVEGHAREASDGAPPRGAQLTLSNADHDLAETIIMANLGYCQFKCQIGSWTLNLKSGKSSDIYLLESDEVEVASWAGTTIYPKLVRRPGKETAEVLDTKLTAGHGGLWSKLKEGFSGQVAIANKSNHADINIFTVASGHLYERFVYIMVSSVMAHTKHSVKFWFISNFLSPQFRRFIPHLSVHLGFEYEMITFKWPHWLRRQTEKQRIIWGYKILFLDVMFPLDLEKVIFVDADQIVRTDMIKLINEDLHGKVWAYTPMGNTRKEIEGFRFWKQGYWKDFLQGKPYHISALYVIDLVAFRAQATGDRLRQQYHQLSADPASLSNLDQDLPNHLQAQIPIHSLSADWLWCETWCSDDSLKDAKTIDLCQNPMTKEPKLDRARRQLPEWNEYDRKIKAFARRLADEEREEGGLAGGLGGAGGLGSIVVDVDSVGQNLEMKRDQLGEEAIHEPHKGRGKEEDNAASLRDPAHESDNSKNHDEL